MLTSYYDANFQDFPYRGSLLLAMGESMLSFYIKLNGKGIGIAKRWHRMTGRPKKECPKKECVEECIPSNDLFLISVNIPWQETQVIWGIDQGNQL